MNTHKPVWRQLVCQDLHGREVVYALSHPGHSLFVFVVQGAFEVQYRLLEGGDGLALWALSQTEIEALSDEAILLLLELPGIM